ncbi:MAG: cell division ATP-binding protein FtsE [Gemmatimonadota bacterium]
MIRFRNVTKTYPKTGSAIEDVTFHIRKGEFVFLTGHSGAGKTTLLQLIHFQTRPTEGQVQISRYNSARVRRRQVPDLRRRVGYVFQDFKLLDRLTAGENVAFALEVTGTPRGEVDGRVQRLLSEVGLAAKARSMPEELSGGERQRVVIARALATDPLVLLADEPTGNLDPRAADGVLQIFRTVNRLGMTIVMATHDAQLIEHNPEIRVLELEHGKLVYDSVAAGAEAAVDEARTAAQVDREEDAPADPAADVPLSTDTPSPAPLPEEIG